jgi:broad specificity phosphatase PhoE
MSERFNLIEKKEREPFGQNVEIRARFLRHGPKDSETWRLTEEGTSASKKYGEQFTPSAEDDKYILKAYTSEIERAQETAKAIIDKVNTDRKGRTRVRLELGEKGEDVKMSTDALSLPYSEYKEQSRQEEKIGEKTISLHQFAQRVASQIEYFIRMSKRFKSDSRVDLINITHFPWLAAFVKEAIGQELEKEENQDKRRGIESKITDLGYLEGFEIIIKRNRDNVELFLKIGDSKFALTEEDIKKIIEN